MRFLVVFVKKICWIELSEKEFQNKGSETLDLEHILFWVGGATIWKIGTS